MQFGLMHAGMIRQGLETNTMFDGGVQRDLSTLEYCRRNEITIQAWSPLQYGFIEGSFIDNPAYPELNETLEKLANKYDVNKAAIAVAWVLRHPANMQVIVGSMNGEHIKDICKAANIKLSNREWYELYVAAGNILP
jgi:predicted oxidoreductase